MSTPTDVVPGVPETADATRGRRHRPQAPEVDPFYRAPHGFGALAPGTILRSREVAIGFLGLVPLQCSVFSVAVAVPQHRSAWCTRRGDHHSAAP